MMRYLYISLLFIALTGCKGHVVRMVDPTEVSRTILIYSEKMKQEKHLILNDSVVYYERNINRIRLDFETQEVVQDLWVAREMLVDLVEGFLDAANNNPSITSQLAFDSLTADDLEVNIVFTTFYGKYVDLQSNALICLKDGVANYFAFTALDCTQVECWQKRSEFYWQSLMFVNFYREGKEMFAPVPMQEKPSLFQAERYLPKSQ